MAGQNSALLFLAWCSYAVVSAHESSSSLESMPLYGPDADDFVAEDMDGDAVLQDIILPPVNETTDKRINKNDEAISGTIMDNTQSIRLADDASAYRQSNEQRTKRSGEVPAILLIAISALALGIALIITLASLIYHRRRSSSSSQNTDPRSSFYAIENEPRPWDSLSFSQSITDLSNNKVHFQSFESLSDDSYINSLDEAINQKASIMHAASKKGRLSSRTQSTITTTRPSTMANQSSSQHDETSLK